jgi:hypothetical protein
MAAPSDPDRAAQILRPGAGTDHGYAIVSPRAPARPLARGLSLGESAEPGRHARRRRGRVCADRSPVTHARHQDLLAASPAAITGSSSRTRPGSSPGSTAVPAPGTAGGDKGGQPSGVTWHGPDGCARHWHWQGDIAGYHQFDRTATAPDPG